MKSSRLEPVFEHLLPGCRKLLKLNLLGIVSIQFLLTYVKCEQVRYKPGTRNVCASNVTRFSSRCERAHSAYTFLSERSNSFYLDRCAINEHKLASCIPTVPHRLSAGVNRRWLQPSSGQFQIGQQRDSQCVPRQRHIIFPPMRTNSGYTFLSE